MIYWNIHYIPWDKLLLQNSARYKEWMVIMADDKGSAKEAGKKEGLVTEVSHLNPNRDTRF